MHHADLDADGWPDRIVISEPAGRWSRDGVLVGRYRVTAHLSASGMTTSRWLWVGLRAGESPWVGAGRIDRVGGKEIVLASSPGGAGQGFHVLAYWNGALRSLLPPAGGSPYWFVHHSAASIGGYRCTGHGIATRAATAVTDTHGAARRNHWRLSHTRYVWRDARWVAVAHRSRRARAAQSSAPRRAKGYGGFACPGLRGVRSARRHWRHHADLDADGRRDQIVITAGRHLHVDQGNGYGRYVVRARLSSNGQVVSRRLRSAGFFRFVLGRGKRPWSPWVGATDVDHVGGQEIVLGVESGASTTTVTVLAYTQGRLVSLPAPGSPRWTYGAVATMGAGFACTPRGVTTRAYANYWHHREHAHRYTISRASYVWHDDGWRRLSDVHTRARHLAPHLGGFDCPGLPASY